MMHFISEDGTVVPKHLRCAVSSEILFTLNVECDWNVWEQTDTHKMWHYNRLHDV